MLMDMHTMLVLTIAVMAIVMLVGALIFYCTVRMFYRLYITAEKRYMQEKKYRQEDNADRHKEFLNDFNSTLDTT